MTDQHDQEDVKTPLSFRIMIVLVVLYLGWRLVEVIVWLWQRLF
ncbi:MAG TPA: hypothetical protein VFZ80_07215 [Acidimicrobiia bacterium]